MERSPSAGAFGGFAVACAVGAERSPREVARRRVGLWQKELAAGFRESPMKRAELLRLKRDAAAVLGNAGTAEDADMPARAPGAEDPLVREHAARAPGRLAWRRKRA